MKPAAVAPPGANDVEIPLGGKKYFLRATVETCIKVSRLNGGLVPSVQKCANLDFDTIRNIVALGIGKDAKELDELIYKEGVRVIGPLCIKFLNNVARGPNVTGDDDEEEEDKEPKDPPAKD